ncbi:MAG: class I SAM-dependent methyltransferase [Betaproteobacteria bacterium]|nr:class I SAM-dependent methyltransferase [Betaproteobacteria bacterium]
MSGQHHATSTAVLEIAGISDIAEYKSRTSAMASEHARRWQFELSLLHEIEEFQVAGYCHVCAAERNFAVDFLYSSDKTVSGQPIPNWRERMVCDQCGLNNRMRAAIHVLEDYCLAAPKSHVFATEQVTALYAALSKRFQNLTGSEFLGETVPFGETDSQGRRNESIANLTFADRAFDYILSFDVLEHVPMYSKALHELSRCLKPSGTLLLSVPFLTGQYENQVRASIDVDGTLVHHLPAQYHGDPIKDAGCLSFYDFGWALLDELRAAGFGDVKMCFYWSKHFGYLGVEQMIIVARKRPLNLIQRWLRQFRRRRQSN